MPDDLAAAIAFFVELGMEVDGEGSVEGRWVDRIVGLDGVRADIAVVRTPDGHSRLELAKVHPPAATRSPECRRVPVTRVTIPLRRSE